MVADIGGVVDVRAGVDRVVLVVVVAAVMAGAGRVVVPFCVVKATVNAFKVTHNVSIIFFW